jgi:predicted RNase H-like HicB family nuclease
MTEYNYRNCQSLFGYSADVHIRCKGVCQLCGCGELLDFDLWRQMTVEHLIGKSQGGYLKQIETEIESKFPNLTIDERKTFAKKIDVLNTVTACQFCNSTTSREICSTSMGSLISSGETPSEVLISIEEATQFILEQKRAKVQWKLTAVRKAFDKYVVPKIAK